MSNLGETRPRRFDDTILMAYVDGELDSATAREIEVAIAEDAATAAKVRLLREASIVVRAAFAPALHEPVPERLLAVLNGPRRGPIFSNARRFAPALAAGIAALAIGLGTLYYGEDYFGAGDTLAVTSAEANNRWLDNVAGTYNLYTRVFTKDERQLIDLSGADLPELENWFSRRLERDLHVPNLIERGLILQGGRALVIGGLPAAQFVYVTVEGEIVALVIARAVLRDHNPLFDQRAGVNTLYWRKDGYSYAFVGRAPEDVLRSIASEAAQQIDKA